MWTHFISRSAWKDWRLLLQSCYLMRWTVERISTPYDQTGPSVLTALWSDGPLCNFDPRRHCRGSGDLAALFALQMRRHQIDQRSIYKDSSKIARKCCLYTWIFLAVWKSTFFASFSLSGSRCMSGAITSTKLEQTGKLFGDSRCCLSAWVSAFWARRMKLKVKWGVALFISADCKIPTSSILFKFSHSILDWTALSWNFGGIFGNNFRGVCGPYHL